MDTNKHEGGSDRTMDDTDFTDGKKPDPPPNHAN